MKKTLLACTISSLFLAGCGSDSDSSSPTPAPQLKPLNGSVILADSTVSALTVYFDENANKQHDQSEPSTTTAQDGSFTLELTEAQFEKSTQVAVRTITTTSQPSAAADRTEVIYSALPESGAETFITPYTSKVVDDLEESLQLIADGEIEPELLETQKDIAEQEVIEEVEASLGEGTELSSDDLFGDFTESEEATKLEEKAKQEESAREEKTIEEEKEKEKLPEPEQPGDEISVTVDVRYLSMIEHYTDEMINLKEKETIIRTKKADGTDEYQGTISKWKLTDSCTEDDLTETNCVYEKAEWTETLGVKDEKGLRSYEHQGHWVKDINQDGLFQFEGQAVETGEKMADGSYLSYKAYYDETNARDEYGIDNGRQYDGGDLIVDGEINLSIVDFAAQITSSIYKDDTQEPKFGANADVNFEQYIEFEDRDGSNSNLETATYSSESYRAFLENGTVIDELSKDWDADGTVNQYVYNEIDTEGNTKHTYNEPKWADGSFDIAPEHYAHYRWDGKGLTNIWKDFNSTYNAETETYCDSGSYSILNYDGTIKHDNADINGWEKCTETLENSAGKDLVLEYVTYYDNHVEAFPEISPNSDSYGHEVRVLDTDENGLTVAYKFAQWGQPDESTFIDDLKGKVVTLLEENGYQADQITIDDIEGLTEVSAEATSSFVYNEDGTPRTWYYRTNDNSEVGQTNLESFTINQEGLDGWKFSAIDGGAVISNVNLDDAYRYSMAANRTATHDSLTFTAWGYEPSSGQWPEITVHLSLEAPVVDLPIIEPITDFDNYEECFANGGIWYDNACHADDKPVTDLPIAQPITDFDNYKECFANGGIWYDNACHADDKPVTDLPIAQPITDFDNYEECFANGGQWYDNACHADEAPLVGLPSHYDTCEFAEVDGKLLPITTVNSEEGTAHGYYLEDGVTFVKHFDCNDQPAVVSIPNEHGDGIAWIQHGEMKRNDGNFTQEWTATHDGITYREWVSGKFEVRQTVQRYPEANTLGFDSNDNLAFEYWDYPMPYHVNAGEAMKGKDYQAKKCFYWGRHPEAQKLELSWFAEFDLTADGYCKDAATEAEYDALYHVGGELPKHKSVHEPIVPREGFTVNPLPELGENCNTVTIDEVEYPIQAVQQGDRFEYGYFKEGQFVTHNHCEGQPAAIINKGQDYRWVQHGITDENIVESEHPSRSWVDHAGDREWQFWGKGDSFYQKIVSRYPQHNHQTVVHSTQEVITHAWAVGDSYSDSWKKLKNFNKNFFDKPHCGYDNPTNIDGFPEGWVHIEFDENDECNFTDSYGVTHTEAELDVIFGIDKL